MEFLTLGMSGLGKALMILREVAESAYRPTLVSRWMLMGRTNTLTIAVAFRPVKTVRRQISWAALSIASTHLMMKAVGSGSRRPAYSMVK